MILFSIRNAAEVEILYQTGFLHASKRWIDPDFKLAYDWMAHQLASRISLPPKGVTYPIWAWYRYAGISKPRPDLRERGHLCVKTQGALPTLQVEPTSVLLSDYVDWHAVLNGCYLGKNDQDDEEFNKIQFFTAR